MSHALSTRPTHGVRSLVVSVVVGWFLLALSGSLLGVFDSEPRPPIPLGLAAVLPVAVFAFCYLTSASFRYPEPLCYQEHDLNEELDFVAVTRRQMARTLRLVVPDAWQRTAVHSETGLVTLRQLLLHAINHLRHHLRFVAEKRAAMTIA